MVESLASLEPMNCVVRRNLWTIRTLLSSLRQDEPFADLGAFRRRQSVPGSPNCIERRAVARTSVQIPILVTAVSLDDQAVRYRRNSALLAVSRDLSMRGIGFTHDAPLTGKYAIVTFDLQNGNTASVLLEVCWSTQQRGQFYLSGGRFQGIVQSVSV